MRYGWYSPPTVGALRSRAAERIRELRKAGREVSPVARIPGNRIATTFWGRAWCDNLLRYSDFENRMPRGRKYVRSGSVVHLAVEPGLVRALVNGTDLYEIQVRILPVPSERWAALRGQCAGEIGSLVDLLSGRPPERVMEIVSRPEQGLFPARDEISLDCSCPDWAEMCKHAAAAMYGVGVRFDEDPEQLFRLRGVSAEDLVGTVIGAASDAESDALGADDLSALFGVAIEAEPPAAPGGVARERQEERAARKKAVRKKAVRKRAVRKKAVRKKAVRKKAVRKKTASRRKS